MQPDIKKKLKDGHVTIGSWMQIPNSSVAEIMTSSGYDWICADLEHGHFSNEILPEIFRTIESAGVVPFARVSANSEVFIKGALDAGARGIIIPNIISKDELKKAISYANYPPDGRRGVGYSRANLFGKNFAEYVSRINSEILIVAQIEDITAVNNLDSILPVKGLDAIMVGPYDLSGSMGITAEFEHPEFKKCLKKIHKHAKQFNIPMGLHIVQPDENELQAKINEGYQFIAYGIDSVFLYKSAQKPEKN
jgi:2-dehydro-3-deoxyglucarate aldolase